MKQRLRLIACVTALFVLQAPLCALACTSASSAHSETIVNRADLAPAPPPCHGTSPHDSAPATPADSKMECACDEYVAGSPPNPPSVQADARIAVIVPQWIGLRESAARLQGALVTFPDATAHPPHDILLLKSTLIL